MPDLKVPIICGERVGLDRTYSEADFEYSDAIPVNMIAVQKESMGNSGFLISHDGIIRQVGGFGAPDRGAIYNERLKKLFRVNEFFSQIDDDFSRRIYGEIPGVDKCSIAYSFQSIMIVASEKAYRFDGTTLTQMTDPDLGKPIAVAWIDSYYVFTDGEYIYHTDIGDETSIDPLKFASSEISPDPIKSVTRTQDDLLMVFNRYTVEYFINTANEQFAFSRLNQKALVCGIVGTHCWSELDGSIFILGGRKEENTSIHIVSAGQITSVATRYIDRIIATYSETELSISYLGSRIENRDKLLYVYLPRHVLVYNHSIAEKFGKDSAWSMLINKDGNKWQATNGVFFPAVSKWVFGDYIDGSIYVLDSTSSAQSGSPVTQEFYSPLIPIESASVDEVELNVVSGQQSNNVYLQISDTKDGFVYSGEWSRQVSAPLNYGLRCIFRRRGYVRKQIGFKFRTLTKEKINVSGMVVRYG